MEAIDTFQHFGIEVQIHADTDAGDPYEQMEQASELLCFDRLHRDFGFGEEFPIEEPGVDGGPELRVLARWLTLFGGYAVAIPFTFHDYGSSGYRASLVGLDSDRAAGFVVVAREKVTEEWPAETTIDGETFTALQMAERCARAEFATWAAWLEDDVYGFVVAEGTPDKDSCWGFYGPGDEYVREEARSIAEDAAFEAEKRRLTERMYLLDPAADLGELAFPTFLLERVGEGQQVGATYRYYGGGTEPLRERSGERVTLVRELDGGTEVSRVDAGRMYRVRFGDGHEADAFAEELTYVHVAAREAVAA